MGVLQVLIAVSIAHQDQAVSVMLTSLSHPAYGPQTRRRDQAGLSCEGFSLCFHAFYREPPICVNGRRVWGPSVMVVHTVTSTEIT